MPDSGEMVRLYIGRESTSNDAKYHVWTPVDAGKGLLETGVRSSCGRVSYVPRVIFYHGMWNKLERYKGDLCKKCRWAEAKMMVLLSDSDKARTPEEHGLFVEVIE
jgi:hypothetical protein